MSIDLSKYYLILGAGITGESVVRFLRKRAVRLRVADSGLDQNDVSLLLDVYAGLDLVAGPFDEKILDSIDILVVSPGLPLSLPIVQTAIARGIEVVGDIELFARVVDCPVVAVTGTNGKSTVVSMLQAMGACSDMQVLCGGNIGEPALNLIGQGADAIILELSSYQLETTSSLKPLVSCLLNVTEDHMDRYHGMADYAAAKQKVFNGAACGVWLLEDVLTRPVIEPKDVVVVSSSTPATGVYGVRDYWLCIGDEPLFDLRKLSVPGAHNALNACFSWVMGRCLGLSNAAMAEGLSSFKGLEHRTELVAEINGVKYFNDSKGTNVGATLVALRSMPSKVVLLAGGDGKSQDFSPLLSALKESVRAVVTYGLDGDKIAEISRGVVPVFSAETLESAVHIGHERANKGDCVLLSPACASFDMFKSYQDRGRAFVACVEGLRA